MGALRLYCELGFGVGREGGGGCLGCSCPAGEAIEGSTAGGLRCLPPTQTSLRACPPSPPLQPHLRSREVRRGRMGA